MRMIVSVDAARSADRWALGDLVERYARAVDARDAAALTACFCAGAVIDSSRGVTVPRDSFADETFAVLARWPVTQHLVTGQLVKFTDEDHASGDVYGWAMQRSAARTPGADDFESGLRYTDAYVRTPSGWLIARRRIEQLWTRPA
jgi:ketosteroid isomerase-like protein